MAIWIMKIYTLSVLCFLSAVPAFSMVTEFVPRLSISEEYTDNYDRTATNKEEEYISYLSPGFSLKFIEKKTEIDLSYTASHRAHDNHSDDDFWEHDFSIDGFYQNSRQTSLIFSQVFSKNLTHALRTGGWHEVNTNTTSAGILWQLGLNNSLRLDYIYEIYESEELDAEDYKSYNPIASLSYWITPQFGFDLAMSHARRTYDLSEDDRETVSGSIRVIKKITRHFQVYFGYSQTFTDQDSGDHTIYNPSLGFDWNMTEDSVISLGTGYLVNEWENSDNESQFFLDADINMHLPISRRGSLMLTGASGYSDIKSDAASLGFNLYYEVSSLLSYQLTRRLTINFNGSYRRDEFDEPDVNRNDNSREFGIGLVWSPYLWMDISLNYLFHDFDTDSSERDDYQENRGTLAISLTPHRPIRFVYVP